MLPPSPWTANSGGFDPVARHGTSRVSDLDSSACSRMAAANSATVGALKSRLSGNWRPSLLFDSVKQANGRYRVAAEFEIVVVDADRRNAENLFPDAHQLALQRISRLNPERSCAYGNLQRRGEAVDIDLAALKSWEAIHDEDGGDRNIGHASGRHTIPERSLSGQYKMNPFSWLPTRTDANHSPRTLHNAATASLDVGMSHYQKRPGAPRAKP